VRTGIRAKARQVLRQRALTVLGDPANGEVVHPPRGLSGPGIQLGPPPRQLVHAGRHSEPRHRLAVQPYRMHVVGEQERRPAARHFHGQHVGGRCAAGDRPVVPSLSLDPLILGEPRGERREPGVKIAERGGSRELDRARVRPESHVVMCVDEAREHACAVGVDHLASGPELIGGIGVVAHPRDPLALDGDRPGPRARVVRREDARVPDQEACHDRSPTSRSGRTRILANRSVGLLAQQVHVAEVSARLLDHVSDDPTQ
jgi:hypothetical protein